MAGRNAGRNDEAPAAAMQAMAQTFQNPPNADENVGSRSLATFQRENPPTFLGRYDPEGALAWLKEIERIFRVMDCTLVQKIRYGTHQSSASSDSICVPNLTFWLSAHSVTLKILSISFNHF